MLELAVAEIHNQDEHVWNMKQDEHNQPILLDRLSPSVPHFDPISLWDWAREACTVGRHLPIRQFIINFDFSCSLRFFCSILEQHQLTLIHVLDQVHFLNHESASNNHVSPSPSKAN